MSGEKRDLDALMGSGSAPSHTERLRPGVGRNEPQSARVVGSTDYKPYGYLPVGSQRSLDLRWWVDHGVGLAAEGMLVAHRFILRVGYSGDDHLRLVLPDCVVGLTGRNLAELRHRLQHEQVTFIQTFHANQYTEPLPPEEPVILAVEVLMGEGQS